MENSEWLEVSLQRVYEENCIAKILKKEIKDATKKGDNYMSDIKRIQFMAILKSGKQIKISLIMKTLPPTEHHQDMVKQMGLFGREITMFRDVTPKMEEILLEFGDYTDPMWGKLICFQGNEQIFFGDLAECGYVMASRRKGLDLEHCLLVMRSLAKFHATTVIAVNKGMIPLNIFGKHVFKNDESEKMMKDYYDKVLESLLILMEKRWEPEWLPIIEKFRTDLSPKIGDYVLNIMGYTNDQFNVINHGDCWVNNMMFKYGLDSVTPVSLKFVDLQMCFYDSPTYDLQYFLSTSLNLEVRQNHLEELLLVYHETLVKQLELYSYPGEIITFEQLKKDFLKRDFLGLMIAAGIMPFIYRQENCKDFPELEDLLKSMKNENKVEIVECDDPMYDTVLKVIIKRVYENHFI
ncbi:uncharacterized protein isoform X2 [Rhodnius prolixus]